MHQEPLPAHLHRGEVQPQGGQGQTQQVRGLRRHTGRGGRLQALPLGAVRLYQGPHVQGVDPHQGEKGEAQNRKRIEDGSPFRL